jgi:hypothetical protein
VLLSAVTDDVNNCDTPNKSNKIMIMALPIANRLILFPISNQLPTVFTKKKKLMVIMLNNAKTKKNPPYCGVLFTRNKVPNAAVTPNNGTAILNNSKPVITKGANTVTNRYTDCNSKLAIVAKFPVPKNPTLNKKIYHCKLK